MKNLYREINVHLDDDVEKAAEWEIEKLIIDFRFEVTKKVLIPVVIQIRANFFSLDKPERWI